MSQVVSTRLPNHTAERLKRLARRLGKTPSETSAMLIEESLRESEHPYIEFRQSRVGRQPYLKNSSLALWEVIQIAQEYGLDEQKTAEHFQRTVEWVRSALLYAEAYPEEIQTVIADAQAITETSLKRLMPQMETITVSANCWITEEKEV
jgi:predicted DNA-binding protein